MSEEKKQKLKEYQKNYREAKKSQYEKWINAYTFTLYKKKKHMINAGVTKFF